MTFLKKCLHALTNLLQQEEIQFVWIFASGASTKLAPPHNSLLKCI